MKQIITRKQWNELTKEEKIVWETKFDGDEKYTVDIRKEYGDDLPSIGQMIEFLGKDWYEYIFKGSVDGEAYPNYNSDKELCDMLWEAVKYKLRA